MLENTIGQYAIFHHIECFFFKELISCVEIVPYTCYCSRYYSNIRVSPIKNERVFCCYCNGRDDGFGENGGDFNLEEHPSKRSIFADARAKVEMLNCKQLRSTLDSGKGAF